MVEWYVVMNCTAFCSIRCAGLQHFCITASFVWEIFLHMEVTKHFQKIKLFPFDIIQGSWLLRRLFHLPYFTFENCGW